MAKQSDVLFACAEFFEGIRVFVTSREKIKHPEGTDLFDEFCRKLREASGEVEHTERKALSHAAGQEATTNPAEIGRKSVGGEAVAWQCRLIAIDTGKLVDDWRECSKESFDIDGGRHRDGAYLRTEYRALYLTPAQPPASAEVGRDFTFAFWNIFKDGKHCAFLSPKSGYSPHDYMQALREINTGCDITAKAMYYGPAVDLDAAMAASSGRKGVPE